MPDAKQSTFAQIAVALREATTKFAEDLKAAEDMAARLPPSPGIQYAIDLLRVRVERVNEGHELIKMISEFEPELRALLETWSAERKPAGTSVVAA